MTTAICETLEQAEGIKKALLQKGARFVHTVPVYLMAAARITDVASELGLARKLQDECGLGPHTSSKAVGVFIGWLRGQLGVSKWLVTTEA